VEIALAAMVAAELIVVVAAMAVAKGVAATVLAMVVHAVVAPVERGSSLAQLRMLTLGGYEHEGSHSRKTTNSWQA